MGRLGFVADLLSKPTILGYMNGLALTIFVGQLPKLLGFSVDSDNFIGDCVGFVQGYSPATFSPGCRGRARCHCGHSGLQEVRARIPGVLVAVVLAIGATILFDLQAAGVKVVGTLPQGMPLPSVPAVGLSDMPILVAGALGIALVALTDTISTGSDLVRRTPRRRGRMGTRR